MGLTFAWCLARTYAASSVTKGLYEKMEQAHELPFLESHLYGHGGPSFVTSSNPNPLLKAPPPNTINMNSVIKFPTHELLGKYSNCNRIQNNKVKEPHACVGFPIFIRSDKNIVYV